MGYSQSQMHQCLSDNPRITLYNLDRTYRLICYAQERMPKMLYFLFRIVVETMSIFYNFLLALPVRLDFVIIQNPPSIPVLFALWIVCTLRGTHFIVDFHNYGYSIMAMNVRNRVVLGVARWLEFYFGGKADYSFCVSEAMKRDLSTTYGIKSATLYDRANTNTFKRGTDQQTVLRQMGVPEGGITIISSTSWTLDEDFSLLLDALLLYEKHCLTQVSLSMPTLSVVITGKGP